MDRSARAQKGSTDRDANQASDQPVVMRLPGECCLLRRLRTVDGRDGPSQNDPTDGVTRGAADDGAKREPVLPSNYPRIRIGISNAAFYVSELRSGDGEVVRRPTGS
jgi:hypothetical protein